MSGTGSERVVHRFAGGSDGAAPYAGLTNVNGTLYGTTTSGGNTGCYNFGCGTAYSITTQGVHTVLYTFGSGSDGQTPNSTLLDVNGTLYGTTGYGGQNGLGTVYSITTSGKEHVLYSFAGGTDGARPEGGLIDVDGTLYGVTASGGSESGACGQRPIDNGCGTIYSITTAGAEKVLYAFAGGTDGYGPVAPLLDVNGTLYGTTPYGGKPNHRYADCCGTVFALTP